MRLFLPATLVGDSTVAEGGGAGFHAPLAGEAEVRKLARNGRGAKSFRDERAWNPAKPSPNM